MYKEIKKSDDVVAIYVCLPYPAEKSDLAKKVYELKKYCKSIGLRVTKTTSEIGCGVDPNRKGLKKILKDTSITILIIDTKDSLSRYSYNYIEALLRQRGCVIKVKGQNTLTEQQLFLMDVIGLVYAYCCSYRNQYFAARVTSQITTIIKNKIDDI